MAGWCLSLIPDWTRAGQALCGIWLLGRSGGPVLSTGLWSVIKQNRVGGGTWRQNNDAWVVGKGIGIWVVKVSMDGVCGGVLGVEDVNGGGSGPSEDRLQGDAPEEGEDGESKCRLSAGAAGGSSSKGTGWTALCSHWNKKRLSIHGSRRTVPSFVEIFGINTGELRPMHF